MKKPETVLWFQRKQAMETDKSDTLLFKRNQRLSESTWWKLTHDGFTQRKLAHSHWCKDPVIWFHTISYMPCLRVALSWSRPRGHTGSRGQLQRCHPQTRDVMILSSYFTSGNVLWWFRFSHLFSEGDTRSRVTLWLRRGWHKILCQLLGLSGLEQGDIMLGLSCMNNRNLSSSKCIGW